MEGTRAGFNSGYLQRLQQFLVEQYWSEEYLGIKFKAISFRSQKQVTLSSYTSRGGLWTV